MKPFATDPTIGTKSMKNNSAIKQNTLEPDNYYYHSSDGIPITSMEITKLYNEQMHAANWSSFDAFINFAFGIWKITFLIDWRSG